MKHDALHLGSALPAAPPSTLCPPSLHRSLPQRDKFEDMLRGLTVERADICAAMAFALDNAESGASGARAELGARPLRGRSFEIGQQSCILQGTAGHHHI